MIDARFSNRLDCSSRSFTQNGQANPEIFIFRDCLRQPTGLSEASYSGDVLN